MKQLLTTTRLAADRHGHMAEPKWHQWLFTLPSSWSIFLLVMVSVLTYFPVFSHRFLQTWDDQWVVQNYYTTAGLSFSNWWAVITEYYNGQYAPVNETWYLLLHEAFGYDAFWFHAGSMLIHIINVIVVYSFVRQLLKMAGTFSPLSVNRIALVSALLIAIHPFLVESVAWLSASKIILYVLFYLLALKGYLRYIDTKKWGWYLYTIVAFILSFGAKEQAVTLPLCLLLLDYTLGRNLKAKRVWLEKIPFILLTLFFGIVTILSQADNGQGALAAGKGYPFYQKVIFAFYCLSEYFVKSVLPVNLMYVYPFPNQIGDPVPFRFWLYPFAIIAIAILFYSFWKQRWIFFGICFFTIHLTTVLHIIPMSRYTIIADRYVYLSAIGVVFMIAYLYDKYITEKPIYAAPIHATLLCYLIYFGVYTHLRCQVWHSPETLKKEVQDIIKQRKDYQPPGARRKQTKVKNSYQIAE